MSTISPKMMEEFKRIYKEEYGEEFKTEAEAQDAAQRLVGFFEVLYQISHREAVRKKRLEKEPKGFHLEEDGSVYNCLVCSQQISGKTGWWDLNGMKCLVCQKAVDSKVIPGSICRDRDSWYARWQLKKHFNLSPSSIKKFIKEGKLKARSILDENGAVYFEVFLIAENKWLFNRF